MKTSNNQDLDASVLNDLRQIKKNLKMLSKNQLINLVFQQMNMSMDMQNANKVLMEKIKQLEGEKNVKTNT